ncbi:MAG: glycosyltransferase family 4 protein [Planctomycetota bacterium]|jgi:UDP-glucose:(heptosyl)LPS alpha-1,3-glucosyltransferase
MNIAFCYESVLPARGGCETYIADLSRRLVADGHAVHLYACRWDAEHLPEALTYHQLPAIIGPRFLRPWRFGQACLNAMQNNPHDVTVGFDKTWGQDVLYPQGGLHVASADYNLRKAPTRLGRFAARIAKMFDVAHVSYSMLERKQYLSPKKPLIIVNSFMVRDHFQHYYAVSSQDLHVIRSSVDPGRFPEHDRLKRRQETRRQWGLGPSDVVGLFAAMNYRLKGLEPLLNSVARLRANAEFRDRVDSFRLVVAGNPSYGRYERLAKSLGIVQQVRFVGHCGEMRNGYFASDFLVHPTFYDPCSLVALEALACGLPVVTTKANGASELLTPPQDGFVVDNPHDHEQLAWCMGKLLDPVRRHAATLTARKTGGQWTFEQHYQQLLAVFREAAARKSAA